MTTVDIQYTASPTFQKFHADRESFVRGIKGPIGSGKSVGSMVDLALEKSIQQRPNAAGFRKTRWVFVRSTYPELKSTTIKTFQEFVPDTICPIRMNDAPINAKLTLPLPDGTCVLSEFLFLALDKPKDLGKLLSLEYTGAFLNEAKELDKAVIDAVTSRVGRYPRAVEGGPTWKGVVMDTNSPSEDHWYAELEQNPPEGWTFFSQPPALLRYTKGMPLLMDPAITGIPMEKILATGFEPNPRAENIKHLPDGYGYYYNSIGGKDPNWVRAYVLNEYATVRNGKPVYGEIFNERIHVAATNLWPVKGHPVYIGMDFGLTPTAIFGQYIDGQLRILDELVAKRMGLNDFIATALMPLIAEKYSKHERIYVGDPAGNTGNDTDDVSCFQTMRAVGMAIQGASTNSIEPRLEAVRYFLMRLAPKGEPAMLLSPHLRILIAGFIAGYQYDRVQVSGEARYRETPSKNKYSHPHDGLQYLCLRVLMAIAKLKTPQHTHAPSRVADMRTGY